MMIITWPLGDKETIGTVPPPKLTTKIGHIIQILVGGIKVI